MKAFSLSVVTPDGLQFEGQVTSLLVHTDQGDLEFLAGHVDYIASIGTGRARIITEGGTKTASCSGGFVTVSGGEIRLVCVTFEFSDQIDLNRARRAHEEAEQKLAAAIDERSIQMARAKMSRALARIKVAENR